MQQQNHSKPRQYSFQSAGGGAASNNTSVGNQNNFNYYNYQQQQKSSTNQAGSVVGADTYSSEKFVHSLMNPARDASKNASSSSSPTLSPVKDVTTTTRTDNTTTQSMMLLVEHRQWDFITNSLYAKFKQLISCKREQEQEAINLIQRWLLAVNEDSTLQKSGVLPLLPDLSDKSMPFASPPPAPSASSHFSSARNAAATPSTNTTPSKQSHSSGFSLTSIESADRHDIYKSLANDIENKDFSWRGANVVQDLLEFIRLKEQRIELEQERGMSSEIPHIKVVVRQQDDDGDERHFGELTDAPSTSSAASTTPAVLQTSFNSAPPTQLQVGSSDCATDSNNAAANTMTTFNSTFSRKIGYLVKHFGEMATAIMLLRYESIGNGSYQWGDPMHVHQFFYEELGVRFEGFASPLNSRLIGLPGARFCSLFPDTDAVFGSMGNFFQANLFTHRGGWSVNPPFVESVMEAVSRKIVGALRRGLESFFFLTFPDWKDSVCWRLMNECEFKVRRFDLLPSRFQIQDAYGGIIRPYMNMTIFLVGNDVTLHKHAGGEQQARAKLDALQTLLTS